MASARLEVLCWNVHLFGRSVTRGHAHDDDRRADVIAERVAASGCDVVGLVEVWDGRLLRRLRERLAGRFPHVAQGPIVNRTGLLAVLGALLLAAGGFGGGWLAWRAGLPQAAHVATGIAGAVMGGVAALQLARGLKALGSGLLLLSRVPFREAPRFNPFLHFTFASRSPDFLALKGVLRVPLEPADGGPVDLYLVHTQAEEGRGPAWVRLGQVAEIGARIERISERARRAGEPVPVALVLGDLNVTAEEVGVGGAAGARTPEYEEMMARLPRARDAWVEASPGLPGFTWELENPLVRRFAPGETRPRRLDYVLWTATERDAVAAKSCTVERWEGSDHWALRATLEVRRAG